MVAADGCQTFCQTVAHNHVDTYGVNKFLHIGTDGSTCRGEEVGVLQSQLLANQREDGAVEQLVFQMQGNRRLLA